MRPRRLILAVTALHFALSLACLIASIGASYGAQRGWPAGPEEDAVARATDLLLFPIVLGRRLLPERWAPGFGLLEVAAVSVLWGLTALGLAHVWRRGQAWRFRPRRPMPGA